MTRTTTQKGSSDQRDQHEYKINKDKHIKHRKAAKRRTKVNPLPPYLRDVIYEYLQMCSTRQVFASFKLDVRCYY